MNSKIHSDKIGQTFKSYEVIKWLRLLLCLKLCVGDGLPAQACSQCVHQVNTSYSFKVQCETSDVTLRQLQAQLEVC